MSLSNGLICRPSRGGQASTIRFIKMMKQKPENQIIIYETKDGKIKLDVKFEGETVWLTQAQMSQLFQKTVPTINEHIKNIYDEMELYKNSTIRKFRIVQKEGKRSVSRDIDYYNLDVIISVGYRVKSLRGTQFRIYSQPPLISITEPVIYELSRLAK